MEKLRRHFNWIYLVVSIPLVGAIAVMVIAGAFVIRRRIISQSLSNVAVSHVVPSGQHPAPDPITAAQSATTTPTATVTSSPVPSDVPATALPTASPIPTYTCTESQGQVLEKSFNSAVAQGTVLYRIYLPPCYAQTNRRYPYVILLHGAGSDETEWTDILGVNQVLDQGIAEGRLPPMILVMPYGGELQYDNSFGQGESFESLIVDDLLPEIDDNYCVWNAQAGRAFGGISRGGFWVFEIGFRHPDLFSALAGHSAYFDPGNAPPANNPLNLAQTVTFSAGMAPRLWLDVAGDDDATRQNLDIFAQTLMARHINPGYTVYPAGGHVPVYWEAHLEAYLNFYGQDWPINPLTLPICRSLTFRSG